VNLLNLEFRRGDVDIRVGGDVVEIFRSGVSCERFLLAWLVVQVQPLIKGELLVRITTTDKPEAPLYEGQARNLASSASHVDVTIRTEEEPVYREFFTYLAQQCGRPVVI
jgi:hypothetical protein